MQPSGPVSRGGGPIKRRTRPKPGKAAVEQGGNSRRRHQHRQPGDSVADQPGEEKRQSHRPGDEREFPDQSEHPQPQIQAPDQVVEGGLRGIVQGFTPPAGAASGQNSRSVFARGWLPPLPGRRLPRTGYPRPKRTQ